MAGRPGLRSAVETDTGSLITINIMECNGRFNDANARIYTDR